MQGPSARSTAETIVPYILTVAKLIPLVSVPATLASLVGLWTSTSKLVDTVGGKDSNNPYGCVQEYVDFAIKQVGAFTCALPSS